MNVHRFFNIFVVLALALTGMAGASQSAVAQGTSAGDLLPYVPGEVVVGFAEGQTPQAYAAQASALAGTVGAQVVDAFANVALLQFAEDADVEAIAASLSGASGVAYAHPNHIRWIPEYLADPNGLQKDKWIHRPSSLRTQVTFKSYGRGNSPFGAGKAGQSEEFTLTLPQLRAMRSIRNGRSVPQWPNDAMLWYAWGWDYSNASIIWPDKALNPAVCVVDTGVDGKHPDLVGKVLAGKDFVNDDTKPDDDNGHGTHVAGTIAAATNNAKGFSGISTAKIVPVKVLSAQGWGTSFDIAQGIIYCANNLSVKVINMSLGGLYADQTEYNALNYAINTKGKLVVAAAGNSSTSDLHFPSGWAVDWVCKDGTDAFGGTCASGNENTIAGGLISVGAASAPFQHWADQNEDGYLWVDTDGDGSEPVEGNPNFFDEHFYPEKCAATFSNYGAWVEVVAPGVDILSTQPVSYAFHNRYFWGADGDGDGYEWYSGTSMATPHVAGGAARAWSAFPLETNQQIAARLQTDYVYPYLGLAMDPNMADPSLGYDDSVYAGEAPYCWPDDTHGLKYDMSNAVYLNVAGAMNRGAMVARINDAVTGLPLEKARVAAYLGTALKDQTEVSRYSPWVFLLNLPAGNYDVKVSKAGYVSGSQLLSPWKIIVYPGLQTPTLYSGLQVAIPPMNRLGAVINWWYDGTDLDLYAFLPNFSSVGGVVGPGGSGRLDDFGPGLLTDFPRARWNRDGGFGDWHGIESISIVPRPGFPTMPYYNQTAYDYYDFFLTDYDSGDLDQPFIFRMWVGGKVVGWVYDWPSCAPGEDWYYLGWMNGSVFTYFGQCGTDSMWPYAAGGTSIQRVPGVPGAHK